MSGSHSHSRKRDQLFDVFRRAVPSPSAQTNLHGPLPSSANLLPSGTTTPSPALQSPDPAAQETLGHKVLDQALTLLSGEQQSALRQYAVGPTTDVQLAVQKAYDTAEQRRKECEQKKWRWTYNGREVVLRDKADRVVRWIDRFKFAGDISSNIAPLYFGLPWVGVRIILEVTESDAQQMATMLAGMDLVLNICNRLKIYLEVFESMETTPAKSNLERALAQMYASTLQFLGDAIILWEKGAFRRLFEAIWHRRALEEFENEVHKLDRWTTVEASNCYWELQSKRWEAAEHWRMDLDTKLQRLDNLQDLQATLHSVQTKLDMFKLGTAEGAYYDSYHAQNLPRCLDGTRTELLDHIFDWASGPSGKCIFWLCGKAGTGKSTIARTVAEIFDKQRSYLEASFFFNRGEGDLGNASRFFPSLAARLAGHLPSMGRDISENLAKAQHISDLNMREQFNSLLLKPLQRAMQSQKQEVTLSLVIDALDECDSAEDLQRILSLLPELQTIPSLRVRAFLTSRPELPVDLGFSLMGADDHQDVFLEEFQLPAIEHDLRLYFRDQFRMMKIRQKHRRVPETLPTNWPELDQVETLVGLAIPLFIFAVTVCRWLSEFRPQSRLDDFLRGRKALPYSGLDRTYLPIFTSIIASQHEEERDQTRESFRAVLGPIVLLADSLSVISLSKILKIEAEEITERLDHLHSVLHVPSDTSSPVRLLHLSLRDYLVDPQRPTGNPLWVSKTQTHHLLAKQCVRRLSEPGALFRDICGVKASATRRAAVSQHVTENAITPDISYACLYWTWHLTESGCQITDEGAEFGFLQSHFLHWLEALAWLGRLPRAVAFIVDLQGIVQAEHGRQLLAFLTDARRFALRNRHIIGVAPLQTYTSALLFAPARSLVRQLCREELVHDTNAHDCNAFTGSVTFSPDGDLGCRGIRDLSDTAEDWGPELLELEGHRSWTHAVAFSPDSRTVASGSTDKTVRLWKATTGEHVQTLEGHEDAITSVVFSTSGNVVASASADCSIRLWNAITGTQLHKFVGHIDIVCSVALSPDSQFIASGGSDCTIQLWYASAPYARVAKLQAHSGRVALVAFSAQADVIASASSDRTVRLWSVGEHASLRTTIWHSEPVRAVAFVSNSSLVSASQDGAIRMWSTDGDQIRVFTGHTQVVNHIVSTANGFIASGSDDRSLRIWDTATGQQLRKFEDTKNGVKAVALTADGKTVAAACGFLIRLLDVVTDEQGQLVAGVHKAITSLDISANGQLIASASRDRTVQLWDAQGIKRTCLVSHDSIPTTVRISPDARLVASICHYTGEKLREVKAAFVNAMLFSADRNAAALQSNVVRLWSATTGEELATFHRSTNQLAFTLDGQHLQTDGGLLDVSAHAAPAAASTVIPAKLGLRDQWVTCEGQDIIWLPYDVRSLRSASQGNLLALGQTSGTVRIFAVE